MLNGKDELTTPGLLYYKLYYGGDDMITLRLDPLLEETIKITAKNLGLTRSDLIRQSILDYLERLGKPDAWEAGQDLFGRYSSGLGNLSMDRKEILKKKIRAKRG